MRSSQKATNHINATHLCRMALSTDATLQLANQLNQLLNRDTSTSMMPDLGKDPTQSAATSSVVTEESNLKIIDASATSPQETQEKKGFRFPWSKKLH